jgi:hypothetical protein
MQEDLLLAGGGIERRDALGEGRAALKFLTGKTRCNQVRFRCDCTSAPSQRFF